MVRAIRSILINKNRIRVFWAQGNNAMKKLFVLLFASAICFGMHNKPKQWDSDDEIGDPRSLSSSVELEWSDGEQQEFQELFDALKKGKGSDRPDANKQTKCIQIPSGTSTRDVMAALRAQHGLENRK